MSSIGSCLMSNKFGALLCLPVSWPEDSVATVLDVGGSLSLGLGVSSLFLGQGAFSRGEVDAILFQGCN